MKNQEAINEIVKRVKENNKIISITKITNEKFNREDSIREKIETTTKEFYKLNKEEKTIKTYKWLLGNPNLREYSEFNDTINKYGDIIESHLRKYKVGFEKLRNNIIIDASYIYHTISNSRYSSNVSLIRDGKDYFITKKEYSNDIMDIYKMYDTKADKDIPMYEITHNGYFMTLTNYDEDYSIKDRIIIITDLGYTKVTKEGSVHCSSNINPGDMYIKVVELLKTMNIKEIFDYVNNNIKISSVIKDLDINLSFDNYTLKKNYNEYSLIENIQDNYCENKIEYEVSESDGDKLIDLIK